MEHTKGPWKWIQNDDDSSKMPMLVSESGIEICDFGDCEQYYPTEGSPPDAPNARIIAAAPDLLEALKSMLVGTDEQLPESFPGHTSAYLRSVAIPRARAAIAKATNA